MLRHVVHASIARLQWVVDGAYTELVLRQVSERLLTTATSPSHAFEVYSVLPLSCPKFSFVRDFFNVFQDVPEGLLGSQLTHIDCFGSQRFNGPPSVWYLAMFAHGFAV